MEIVKTMPFQVADITNYLSTKLILDETFQVYQVKYALQVSSTILKRQFLRKKTKNNVWILSHNLAKCC